MWDLIGWTLKFASRCCTKSCRWWIHEEICCAQCCRSRTRFYCCNIARNKFWGGYTMQFSHCAQYCAQYCTVYPDLNYFSSIVEQLMKETFHDVQSTVARATQLCWTNLTWERSANYSTRKLYGSLESLTKDKSGTCSPWNFTKKILHLHVSHTARLSPSKSSTPTTSQTY